MRQPSTYLRHVLKIVQPAHMGSSGNRYRLRGGGAMGWAGVGGSGRATCCMPGLVVQAAPGRVGQLAWLSGIVHHAKGATGRPHAARVSWSRACKTQETASQEADMPSPDNGDDGTAKTHLQVAGAACICICVHVGNGATWAVVGS